MFQVVEKQTLTTFSVVIWSRLANKKAGHFIPRKIEGWRLRLERVLCLSLFLKKHWNVRRNYNNVTSKSVCHIICQQYNINSIWMIVGNYRQNRERAFKFFWAFSQTDETSQMHHKSNKCICIIKHNFSVYTSDQLWFFFFHKCYLRINRKSRNRT